MQQRYLEDVHIDSNISWAAYHANQQPQQGCPPTTTAMLPLFPDDSKCCYDTSLYGHDQESCTGAQPNSNPSDHSRSTTLCHS